MRALNYLVAVDESFDAGDFDRVGRFLRDVLTVAPAADIGCIVRVTRMSPFISLPVAGDGPPAARVGPTVVTRFCSVDTARRSWHGGSAFCRSPPTEFSYDQAWTRLYGVLSVAASDNGISERLLDADGFAETANADAIICLRPARGDAAELTGSDLMVCQLANRTDLPLWRCPVNYRGMSRVVVALTGRASDVGLCEAARVISRSHDIPVAAVCADNVSPEGRPWRDWPILRCSFPQNVPNRLEPDDLLLMGAEKRSWFERLFTANHSETILEKVENPVLVLPRCHLPVPCRDG